MAANRPRLRWILFVKFLLLASMAISADSVYDPLGTSVAVNAKTIDLSVHDTNRLRDIPIRVYLPSAAVEAPVILFSHGNGGSREGNTYLGNHWASRGYVAVFLQHPGSDASVWEGEPLGQRRRAIQGAASGANFKLRVKDVPAVLDQLDRWNNSDGHVLSGHMNLTRVGMSGHSFGAVTTQAVSGQTFGRGAWSLADSRIKAAIAFSPSGPRRGGDPKQAFGKVKIPWMLMTGTKDFTPFGGTDLKSRLSVFPALPPGGKYELVLYDAEHSAFSERSMPGKEQTRNPNHHRVILALTTAFWDAWLNENPLARSWLDGSGPNSLLEKDDVWQTK